VGILSCHGTKGAWLEPWLDADLLFRNDAKFRGADSAYSVDLGQQRVLWLFGDTFVGEVPNSRSGSEMVRNAIAVQQGYDPTSAVIAFHFGSKNDAPAAFFATDNEGWLWPGPGVRLDSVLLLLMMHVRSTSEGLGFETVGSEALLVENPDDDPTEWSPRTLQLPPEPAGVKLGAGAVLLLGDYLYSFAPVEPGNHDLYLARWHRDDVRAGTLQGIEWWADTNGFVTDGTLARPVVRDVQTELSVHQHTDGQLMMISVDGFGSTNVVARTAPAPHGPWSDAVVLARPTESERPGVLVYSAKAHPELRGSEFVVTYCTNHSDFPTLVKDMNLYFPRFLRRAN